MRTITAALLALFAFGARAQHLDETWMSARCIAKYAPRANPTQGASVLYVPFNNAPGCYATGSTALATNGAAMTFSRSSIAYLATTPEEGWWKSCPANNLRISGNWAGALMDAEATNRLAAPTDSPTITGGWSCVTAGCVVGGGGTFIDGTATQSQIVEQAGVVNGIQQSVTTTADKYAMHAVFGSYTRKWVSYVVDGAVWAKFDIEKGCVSYVNGTTFSPCASVVTVPGGPVVAGSEYMGKGYSRPWAMNTTALTAAAHTFAFNATNAPTDNTVDVTTGGTVYLARTMVQKIDNYTPTQPTVYAAAGTPRTAEYLSFPITLADGNVCVSIKVEPYGSTWDSRTETGIFSLQGASNAFGSANSAYVALTATQASFAVYDNAAAVKLITMTFSTPVTGTPVPNGRPRVIKACTDTSGNMKLAVDQSVATTSTGAGTGIFTTPPTKIFVGTKAGTGAGSAGTTFSVSDLTVCPVSDPNLCGDWVVVSDKSFAAIGTSITVGYTAGGYIQSWPQVAAAAAGVRIAQIDKVGWFSPYGLNAIKANCSEHRWKKVAVDIGTNDIGANTMDTLRAIYDTVRACGATPIPMTIAPRNDLNATQIAARPIVNAAIKRWGSENGYAVADIDAVIDPTGTGSLPAGCDPGDGVHWNQTCQNAVGAYMAPFFQ